MRTPRGFARRGCRVMSEQELAAQRAANEESFLEWCADYWRSKLYESNEYVARLYDVRPEHLFGIPVLFGSNSL